MQQEEQLKDRLLTREKAPGDFLDVAPDSDKMSTLRESRELKAEVWNRILTLTESPPADMNEAAARFWQIYGIAGMVNSN